MIPVTKRGGKRQTVDELTLSEPFDITEILSRGMNVSLEGIQFTYRSTKEALPLYPMDHLLSLTESRMLRLSILGNSINLHSCPMLRALLTLHKQNILIHSAQAVSKFAQENPEKKCRVILTFGPADSIKYANTDGKPMYGWIIEEEGCLRIETEVSFSVQVVEA